ncbi:MAG: anthranilate phosphoribosyltransferase [Hyphomonadaceae bacterium]|nr:anthranilate phosphoribosyltransferase [Hyphomonadaceae bacterium]
MTEVLRDAIKAIARHEHVTQDLLEGAFEALLSGEASGELIAAFLTGLAVRGETSAELVAGARIMRSHARRHDIPGPLLDTCGTGGLPWKSLNTSTASAIVIAAAGGRVAKHGNRSVPPKTGSADVLEALGVNLDVDNETFRHCVEQAGVGFLFARTHHSAMRHVAPVRQELGIRTIFNLLGPLTNPAGATHQILGVYEEKWVRPMAEALAELGITRAWVVHGVDGIDEISISGVTKVADVSEGKVLEFEIKPENAGLETHPLSALEGASVDENARAILELLDGQAGPFRDVVSMNAGCGLYLLGLAEDIQTGTEMAAGAIESGAARRTLTDLVNLSHGREV